MKVGDKIVLGIRDLNNFTVFHNRIDVVKSISKVRGDIKTARGFLFDKDLNQKPNGMGVAKLYADEPKPIEKTKNEIITAIKSIDFDKLSTEKLRMIARILIG